MASKPSTTWSARRQFLAWALFSVVVFVGAVVAAPSSAEDYARFLAGLPPLAVFAGAAVLGGLSLGVLRRWSGFEIVAGGSTLRGCGLAALMATGIAIPILFVDVFLRYPETINVPMPRALLFYPTIGFVAEVAFHLVPLAVLIALTKPLRERFGGRRVDVAALGLVALVEPTFQVMFAGGELGLIDAYTGVHVLAISAMQLYLFRRYDFATMYVFRLVYYAWWHLAWGTLRLELLFG